MPRLPESLGTEHNNSCTKIICLYEAVVYSIFGKHETVGHVTVFDGETIRE